MQNDARARFGTPDDDFDVGRRACRGMLELELDDDMDGSRAEEWEWKRIC